MKKAKLFLSTLFVLISVAVSAQNIKVTGVVKDQNGDPLQGATVMLQGNGTVGTATNIDGEYSLTVPSDGVLVATMIGYADATAPVNGKKTVNFVLNEDSQFIENAVIVGYGSAKKVGTIVGSVSTVNSETLKNAPSSSALDQLQGQVAGLSILNYSGIAGDNAVTMQLHGVGSFSASSTPLYVVDGIPSTSRSVMALNPNDIESVSVLKDASATSIYGSRAANGVVYISTKSGSYNEKASVTIRSQYGISTLADLSLYKSMMSSQELMDFWVSTGIHSADWIKANFIDQGWTADTKWYQYMMDLNNPQYQNDVTIEGGGQKVAYMIAASQYHQKGYTPGNFYDRYTLRTNVQGHPLNWLKIGTNLNFSYDITQQNPNWGSAANGMSNYTGGGLSYLLIPMYPAVDENGKVYEERFPGQNRITPHYYMDNHIDQYDRYGLNGNAYIEIEPVRNLKFVSRAGLDGYFRWNEWKTFPSYTDKNGGTPVSGKGINFEYTATITNTAEYSFELNDLNKFSVLLGQEGVNNKYSYFYAQSQKQVDDRQMRLQDGTSATYAMEEDHSAYRFLSWFGHVDYTFADKYIFDATLRNDSSSRFGADNRSAKFWSLGALWKAKKEALFQNINWINDLNVKLSYGTQGNAEIGNYAALGIIDNSGSYNDVSARYVVQPANQKLTWEQQGLFTFAIDGRIYDAIDFDVEFYNRQTSNMLMAVPQPYTTGFDDDSTDIYSNVGGLNNKGVDITLGIDLLKGRDHYLRFNTTFNYNKQTITELFDGRSRWEIANTGITYVVGSPVMFYYPLFAGIDPEDGAPTWYLPYEDENGVVNHDINCMDPKRTTKTFDSDALTQNTGKVRYAPINGGFGFSGGFKGLSFQMDFVYVLGKNLISNDGYFYGNPANFSTMNTNKAVSDYWTPNHTDAKWPDWSKGYTMQFDSHLLEDASFLRLKNLQIAYALPKSLLKNTIVKDLKITFTGRNLLTATKYTGIDPEINSNLSYGVGGNSKQILGGIEVTF